MNINKKYNGNLDWNVNGLFSYDRFWLPFLAELKNHNIDFPFQYIYGTPYGTKAGGGRWEADKFHIQSSSLGLLQDYINLGVGCRLALSNHLLKEEDFKEKQLNYAFMILNDYPNNGVIISDDRFNEYIKSKYPNIQRICSVIRPAVELGWGNESPEYYNKLCENYDIVVINCGFAKDLEKINKLKYKDKIEVLVNSRCTLNCPLAKTHYDIVAEGYLMEAFEPNREKELELHTREVILLEKCHEIKMNNILDGSNFTIEEVQELINNGIHHFKLEGRGWPLEVVIGDLGYYVCDKTLLTRLCKNITGSSM